MTEMLRIAAATAHSRWRAIHASQRPLVIRGLFDGQPISAIRTVEEAVARLGEVPLELTVEYTADNFASQRADWKMEIPALTLAEYAQYVEREPRTPLICLEQTLPRAISSLFNVPDFADAGDGDELRMCFFFGNAGNASNLHFDGDMRSALLHQIAGRKRAVCIPPTQSFKLFPMNNFSGVLLYNYAAREREELLRYTGGFETLLEPGDTLFIPAGWWHHLDYVDTGLSFNIRLRRNALLRLLGDGRVHTNYKTQAIGATLVHGGPDSERVRERVLQVLERPTSGEEKFAEMEALYDELYATVCAHYPQQKRFASLYPCSDAELYRRRLDKGTLYGRAEALAS
ncbi:MAG TPA: cupin-like domain-containing protein [Thermoanaerobaculia bacterium]|jgi:ribosomal protein L16 Arg81 hydroxylase